MSTLKIHVRKPKDISKDVMMKRVVKMTSRLKGVSVLRYKEKKPKPRRKAFTGPGSYTKRVQNVQESNYQENPARKKNLRQGFDMYTKTGPNTAGPYDEATEDPDWLKAPPGAPGGLEEKQLEDALAEECRDRGRKISIKIKPAVDKFLAFDIHPELNQKIWLSDEKVRAGVRGALMDIVEEFLEGLDLDVQIKDVIVTGSIANFNWSRFSDIDLHILIDFNEVNDNEEMVKRFFDAVRSNWNKLHDIKVKGHEVEIYVQDEKEPHVSTGVFSLLNDRWLVKPKKVRPAIDRATATKKMKQLAREIDKLSRIHDAGNYEDSFAMATKLKEKIKKMRQGGLEADGIYSPENLAFKMLRRSGDIEQLFALYTQAYDKLYSLDQ
jgi:predicted nucleotidyltransferase